MKRILLPSIAFCFLFAFTLAPSLSAKSYTFSTTSANKAYMPDQYWQYGTDDGYGFSYNNSNNRAWVRIDDYNSTRYSQGSGTYYKVKTHLIKNSSYYEGRAQKSTD